MQYRNKSPPKYFGYQENRINPSEQRTFILFTKIKGCPLLKQVLNTSVYEKDHIVS